MTKRAVILIGGLLIAGLLLCGCENAVYGFEPETIVMVLADPTTAPETVEMETVEEAPLEPLPTVPPTPEPTEAPTPEPTEAPTATPAPTEEPTPTPKATKKPRSTPKPTSKPKATPKPPVYDEGAADISDGEILIGTQVSEPEPPAPAETPEWKPPKETPLPAETEVIEATPIVPTDTGVPEVGYTEDFSVPSGVTVSGKYSEADIAVAARVAAMEAGKSEEGYRAVLNVIANRVESSGYPNTVYDVAFQKNQFSVTRDRARFWNYTVPTKVYEYANDVFNNANRMLDSNVVSFRAAKTDKTWGTRTYVGTYGGNDFYS